MENIHYTRDGGKTWKNANSGYTAMRFMDIFILSPSTIFMSGNDGIIIRSIDSGATWQTMNSGTNAQLWGLYFLDATVGLAVGSNGTIIRTHNGGMDWESIPSGISNLFYDVYFTKAGIGFASGSNVLFKSIDRGLSWHPVDYFPFEAPADWIRCIQMVNETIGYACADIGRIYKTTDGGDHWERLNSITQEALFDLEFVDENTGMICGFDGSILYTNDGGLNWTSLVNPLGTEHLYSIDLISENIAYICTHMGHVLKWNHSTATKNPDISTYGKIYPIPCKDQINLSLNSITRADISDIELCNITGQCSPISVQWNNDHLMSIKLDDATYGLQILKLNLKSTLQKINFIFFSN
jgi:photosystem II stability/assembly factor-like uncharacterized protein